MGGVHLHTRRCTLFLSRYISLHEIVIRPPSRHAVFLSVIHWSSPKAGRYQLQNLCHARLRHLGKSLQRQMIVSPMPIFPGHSGSWI